MSSDLRLADPPPRAELLQELRAQLPAAEPGLRVIAQELLGADSRIDFVGVDAAARVVVVCVGEREYDVALLARGLAQRAWVTPRVDDWLKLAPDLGARAASGVRLLLLAPRFAAETETAASALGDDRPELWTYTCVRNGSGVAVLLAPPSGATGPPPAPPRPSTQGPPAEPTAAPAFRTGLDESELGLTPAERREFE